MVTEGMMKSFDGTGLHFRKDIREHPKAAVVIVHGLCEHLGRYDYLTEKLYGRNFSVYRFDHRGHGKSEGKRVFYNSFHELVGDVNAAVEAARKENPALPVFLIGHSMGGMAVALFGTQYPGKVTGIVTSGALTCFMKPEGREMPLTQPADTYVPNTLGSGVCSDPAVVEAYAKDPLVEKQVSVGLINCCYEAVKWLGRNRSHFVDPVFLMHGCNDGLVSEQNSREFFGAISSKDKSLKIFANLCHEIFNERSRDEVIEEAISWIEKRV